MKFQVSSNLQYEVFASTTFIFNIQAFATLNQIILEEKVLTEPYFELEEFGTPEARFIKLFIPEKMSFKIMYNAEVSVFYKIINEQTLLNLIPIFKLSGDVIPYLFPSRYCQSDKLEKLAIKEFGMLADDFDKVVAINEWIYNNVDYLPGFTNSNTSAQDTLTERVGVCRDFAHLGIALCRALSIPARYFTAYAFKLYPQDFHACFEAFIGGDWIFFDPTKLVPINGLVKIANGRDAADASIASIFGDAICTSMVVQCEMPDADFKDYTSTDTTNKMGLSYQ